MNRPSVCVLIGVFAFSGAALASGLDLLPDKVPDEQVELDTEPRGMFGRLIPGWSGSVEVGLTGSTGNVERVSGRGGVRAERRTDFNHSRGAFTYIFAREDGSTAQNEAHLMLRNDRLFEDSPWRLFGLGMFDYDKFKDWNYRLAGFLGVGYAFIDTERTELIGRVGAGLMREFGGEDDSITPEGLLGADFRQQITERQQVTATVDFFPELDDFGEYRWVASAAYEILVDPEINMSLRLGVESQYDSTPGPDVKRHDLDYFATLVWAF